MEAVQPQTTQLEFYQAMADFKTMFPLMDDEVIEAVLRSNEGAVDATIDQLLSMSTDNENEKIRHQLEVKEKLPSSDQTVPNCESTEPKPLRSQKGWDSLVLVGMLPVDFLRLPPEQSHSEGELEDERIAMLLQNEEFMSELRWNKEFLSTLEKGWLQEKMSFSKLSMKSSAITGERLEPMESPPEERLSSFSARLNEDEAAFKERLRHMGHLSKKKFSQLARVFTGRKKRGAKSILGQGAKDNLLLKEDCDTD